MSQFSEVRIELSLLLRRARRRLFSRQAWMLLHRALPVDDFAQGVSAFSFREAEREDVEQIAASLPVELAGNLTRRRRLDLVTSRFENNVPCVVAVDDCSGRVVAGCWCTPLRSSNPIMDLLKKTDKAFEISTLFVLPETRGSGVGSQVVAYACNAMFQRGYRTCFSLVWYTRPASIKAHLKVGFQPIGEKVTVSFLGLRRTRFHKAYQALDNAPDRMAAKQ